jgi:hypothetical protein
MRPRLSIKSAVVELFAANQRLKFVDVPPLTRESQNPKIIGGCHASTQ